MIFKCTDHQCEGFQTKTPDEKSIRCTLDQDVTYRITKRVKKVVDGKEVKDPKTGLPVWEDVKGSMEDISPIINLFEIRRGAYNRRGWKTNRGKRDWSQGYL